MLSPLVFAVAAPPALILQPGMVISKSCTVAKKTYAFASVEGQKKAGDETIPTLKPTIAIKGNNITVDFAGATLQGTSVNAEPDQRKGLAIEVTGKNITIKNLNVHGYKVGLIARKCQDLVIDHCDFSYNWKQHLKSTLEKEDLSDWMSYHHNEHDEWLRYGAGIYLSDVQRFEVKNNTIHGGQCALMLNRCYMGRTVNNDFSFNSGIGVGLYRTSYVGVAHNKIDWCVRGYSHGVYNRGQDSAGILVFEQSNQNLFAYNSVTHGGDGFFLWAGQTTMDTGKGGCNGNTLMSNDFSYAPTNGIEATFSTNRFINNKISDCWHGVWGGYSSQTLIEGNHFQRNEVGIAIEHGQNNVLLQNSFDNDKVGIQLWQNKSQDPNWGYPKYHDTKSHKYEIIQNGFYDVAKSITLKDTSDVMINGNTMWSNPPLVIASGETPNVTFVGTRTTAPKHEMPGVDIKSNAWGAQLVSKAVPLPWEPFAKEYITKFSISPLKGLMNPFLKPSDLQGRKYILVDEWGPYDFKTPLLWPRETLPSTEDNKTVQRFEILGPKGTWKLAGLKGAEKVSATSGTVPGYVDVTLPKGAAGLTKIGLVYVGGATTDYKGITTPAGKPVPFGYSKFFAPIDWEVKFFAWKTPANSADVHSAPLESAFQDAIHGAPLQSLTTDRLDFAGYAFVKGLPNNHYATVADGSFNIPAGKYEIQLTTDDGARVFLDGKPLISDAWHYQGPTTYSKTVMLGGNHKIHLEHFQIDGYATLKLVLKPVK